EAGLMLLVLARGLFVASILSSFGAALFEATLMRTIASGERPAASGVRIILWLSLARGLAAGLAWFAIEAMVISDTSRLADTPFAEILIDTNFGRVLALQL